MGPAMVGARSAVGAEAGDAVRSGSSVGAVGVATGDALGPAVGVAMGPAAVGAKLLTVGASRVGAAKVGPIVGVPANRKGGSERAMWTHAELTSERRRHLA